MESPFQGLDITQGGPRPENADHAIEEFYNNFSLEKARQYFSELLACALTEGRWSFSQVEKRENILFFCEHAWYLVQAVRTLHAPHSPALSPTPPFMKQSPVFDKRQSKPMNDVFKSPVEMPFQFRQLNISQVCDLPTADAAGFMEDFFHNFDLEGIHEHITELLHCALAPSEFSYTEPRERANVLFFCAQSWYAFQAMYKLYKAPSKPAEPSSPTENQ